MVPAFYRPQQGAGEFRISHLGYLVRICLKKKDKKLDTPVEVTCHPFFLGRDRGRVGMKDVGREGLQEMSAKAESSPCRFLVLGKCSGRLDIG